MTYSTSPLKMAVYALDVVIALVVVCGVILMVRRIGDQKKTPDKCKSDK